MIIGVFSVVTFDVNVAELFEMVHLYKTCKAWLMFIYVLHVVRSFKISSGHWINQQIFWERVFY